MDKVELDRIRKLCEHVSTEDGCPLGSWENVISLINAVPALLDEVDRMNEVLLTNHRALVDERAECNRRVCQLEEQKKGWIDATIELQRRVCELEADNQSLKDKTWGDRVTNGAFEQMRQERDSENASLRDLRTKTASESIRAEVEMNNLKSEMDRMTENLNRIIRERDFMMKEFNAANAYIREHVIGQVLTAKKTITDLVKEANANAAKHGFWDKEPNFGELIALCHSELSEALEAHRAGHAVNEIWNICKDCKRHSAGKCNKVSFTAEGGLDCKYAKPEGVPTELADCVIRIFDICGHYGIDLEAVIARKMAYNKTRERLHGKGY